MTASVLGDNMTGRRVAAKSKRAHAAGARVNGAPRNAAEKAAGRSRGDLAAVEDEIYRSIYEALLDHRLAPGTKLKEVALADVFGVNRSVIRMVLARLEHNRLVELRPNRGAVVAKPSIEESRDLFVARRAIEGAIINILTPRITKDQLRELRALVKQEQNAYHGGDTRAGVKMSIQFHRALAEMAGNTVLADMLDQLVSRTPLVVLAYKGTHTEASCNNDEHSLILDAIAAGDADTAVAAANTHLQSLESQLDLQEEEEQPTDLAEIFGVRRR